MMDELKSQGSKLKKIIEEVLRPKMTKKIILFFFGFQNYVN